MKKKIFFVVNVDHFFVSHRLDIAKFMFDKNFEVHILTKITNKYDILTQNGFIIHNINFSRSNLNFVNDFFVIYSLFKIYYSHKPDIVHHITIKPIIYGSFVSKFLKIKLVVNSFSGLGYLFIKNRNKFIKNVLKIFSNFVFNKDNIHFIFQNLDDYNELLTSSYIRKHHKYSIIKGSGINLNLFKPNGLPLDNKKKVILFPSRMLWDKGVMELYLATKILKRKYQNKIIFLLAGNVDSGNKSSVSHSFLNNWNDDNYIKWIGFQENMLDLYLIADIVILPSYREGLPKSLIEACATGRPIITTNSIGCKECVEDGVNGFLVPVFSHIKLVKAIIQMINNPDLLISMGQNSRKKALNEFDIKSVIDNHFNIYNSIS